MANPKSVFFNGIEYRLMGAGRYYLSQSKTNAGRRNAKGLHVAIWEYHSGQTVPAGYVIHHKDGNCSNNDFDNLECLPRGEHLSRHLQERYKHGVPEEIKAHLNQVRIKASAWHRSPEGRKWHSETAKKRFSDRHELRVCPMCGGKFEVRKSSRQKHCSRKCGNRHAWECLHGVQSYD